MIPRSLVTGIMGKNQSKIAPEVLQDLRQGFLGDGETVVGAKGPVVITFYFMCSSFAVLK